jgi:uridylate kinase
MGESAGTNGSGAGYSRVLLKLGGEMFGGGSVGLDPDVVAQVARQIAEVVRSGVQVAVVIGGGNFFRGAQLQQRGMERTRSDSMGMLGTVMNSLALQDFLENEGIVTRVQTAITMAACSCSETLRIAYLLKCWPVPFNGGASDASKTSHGPAHAVINKCPEVRRFCSQRRFRPRRPSRLLRRPECDGTSR